MKSGFYFKFWLKFVKSYVNALIFNLLIPSLSNFICLTLILLSALTSREKYVA